MSVLAWINCGMNYCALKDSWNEMWWLSGNRVRDIFYLNTLNLGVTWKANVYGYVVAATNKCPISGVVKLMWVCEPTWNGFNSQTVGRLYESHRRCEKASSSEITTQEAYLCRRACSWPFQCQDGKNTPVFKMTIKENNSKTTTTKKYPHMYRQMQACCVLFPLCPSPQNEQTNKKQTKNKTPW